MRKISAYFCLTKGLKALHPNLSTSIAFTTFLSAIGVAPNLISRLKGHAYSTPPISLWGFLMSLIWWTTLTLILVGVSQVVWGNLKKAPRECVHLLPSEKVRPQIFLWSISFTVMIFSIHMGGSWLLAKAGRGGPFPILPLVFYFAALIPLMMVDRQLSMWIAMKQTLSAIKVNFVLLLKLALTAEAVFLAITLLGIALERLVRDAFSIPDSVVTGQVISIFVAAPIWVINSAMMAVAYAELQGLSVVGHQKSGSPVYEGR